MLNLSVNSRKTARSEKLEDAFDVKKGEKTEEITDDYFSNTESGV
jgi:hypothetical protein